MLSKVIYIPFNNRYDPRIKLVRAMKKLRRIRMSQKTKQTLTTLTIALLILPIILAAIPIQPTSAQWATVTLSKIPATATHPYSIELIAFGQGEAEWTTEVTAYSGSYSVKLYAPGQGDNYGDYGKIVMPLEMAFEDLEGFSFYFKQTQGTGVPFHEIHIDVTEDVTLDSAVPSGTLRDAYRVIIASQPLHTGLYGDYHTSGVGDWESYDENGWLEYTESGVQSWDAEDDETGWAIYWYDEQGNCIGSAGAASGQTYTWNQIHTYFDGKAIIKDVRVELRYPDTDTTAYVDLIELTISGSTVEIDLEPSANVGDKVTVSGTGATPGGELKVYWDAVKDWDGVKGLLVDDVYAESDGSFEVEITVPDAVAGAHQIYVYDVMAPQLSSALTLIVEPEIVLDPNYGLPGDMVTVNGTGFADESSITVRIMHVTNETVGTGDGDTTVFYLGNDAALPPVVYVNGEPQVLITDTQGDYAWEEDNPGKITFTQAPPDGAVITATYEFAEPFVVSRTGLESSETGNFTMNFEIPDFRDGIYMVEAIDGDENIAIADLTITKIYIRLEPKKGLPETEVTVTGRGFTPSSTVDIYFGVGTYPEGFFQKVKTGVKTDSAGDFETTFIVPSAVEQDYTVAAEDEEGVIAQTTFTVVAAPEITVSPKSGLPEDEITVNGTNFTPDSTVTIYMNTTILKDLVKTDSDGAFETTVKIPEDASLGSYVIKAVDEEGLSATATFDVVEKRVIITTRLATYAPGQKVSFYLNSTLEFATNITVEIKDPEGVLFASGVLVPERDPDTGIWVVPYANSSFGPLPDDVFGDWNWTAKYRLATETKTTEVTGTFTVAPTALPGVKDLTDRVSALEDSMATLSEKLEALSDKVDTLSTAVSALNIQAVSEAISSVREDVTGLKQDLTGLKTDLTSVKSDISDVSDTVSDVQSAVQNAVDAAAEAKSAAENASTAVSGIQTAVYGAIILALIAAVAAIMTVVTLQRKIAG